MRKVGTSVLIVVTALVLHGSAGCDEKNEELSGCDFCEGGCAAQQCNVDCVGEGICADRTYNCPEGKDCILDCNGVDACDNVVVNCPPDHACTMLCEGRDACGDTVLNCSTGPCTMECGTHVDSCEGGTVNCGAGDCTVTCAGSVSPTVNDCDQAASCTTCPTV